MGGGGVGGLINQSGTGIPATSSHVGIFVHGRAGARGKKGIILALI